MDNGDNKIKEEKNLRIYMVECGCSKYIINYNDLACAKPMSYTLLGLLFI